MILRSLLIVATPYIESWRYIRRSQKFWKVGSVVTDILNIFSWSKILKRQLNCWEILWAKRMSKVSPDFSTVCVYECTVCVCVYICICVCMSVHVALLMRNSLGKKNVPKSQGWLLGNWLGERLINMYTHTHTHTYVYTHTHRTALCCLTIYAHTHAYAHTRTCTHTHTHTCTHMYTHTHKHTHMYRVVLCCFTTYNSIGVLAIKIFTYRHIYIHTYLNTYSHHMHL